MLVHRFPISAQGHLNFHLANKVTRAFGCFNLVCRSSRLSHQRSFKLGKTLIFLISRFLFSLFVLVQACGSFPHSNPIRLCHLGNWNRFFFFFRIVYCFLVIQLFRKIIFPDLFFDLEKGRDHKLFLSLMLFLSLFPSPYLDVFRICTNIPSDAFGKRAFIVSIQTK